MQINFFLAPIYKFCCNLNILHAMFESSLPENFHKQVHMHVRIIFKP